MTASISPLSLSERELDVLCLLVRGYGNGQIATELQLSIRTVSAHIAGLKQKFCVESRADLIRFIRQNGLGC
jgi:Response regulator containing a CheY-like receiver domain and an HTH DNA-binding domain